MALIFFTSIAVLCVLTEARGEVAQPPPKPPILSWPPTYNMSLSTFSNPDGSYTGPDSGVLLARDAQYGIITFDGNFEACLNDRAGPPGEPCKYKETQADVEQQAKNIKSINPHTRVFTYHNQEELLLRNQQDCLIMRDPEYVKFFIHNSTGIVNNQVRPRCTSIPNATYEAEDQYALDFRNENASRWWLETVIGAFLQSPVLDGFYWDCPTVTSPFSSELSPSEISDINTAMAATRQLAETRIAAAGKWALNMFDHLDTPNSCPITCSLFWRPESNCSRVCDRTPETCMKNLQQAASSRSRPGTMTVPYLAPSATPNLAVCSSGPSVVADINTPEPELALACVPGTGSMTVDFASFGLPRVRGNGRFIVCAGKNCSSSNVFYEDLDREMIFDASTPQSRDDCSACLHRKPLCTVVNVSAAYLSTRSVSLDPFSCGVQRNCASFAVDPNCDTGPAVLAALKAKCDGTQSCRFNISELTLRAPPKCSAANTTSPLRLAVRATGCQQGTAVASFREHLASFLLARGPQSWMGHNWIAGAHPIWYPEWDVDFGSPAGDVVFNGMTATRAWTKFNISMDCATFTADFVKVK
eukprot:m.599627 g.599627  ORF g.599627 m.599627 type:complete len:587 (+) comp22427_c0_seq3:223-1983(+)